jgi:hypothetical protein
MMRLVWFVEKNNSLVYKIGSMNGWVVCLIALLVIAALALVANMAR